MELSSSIDFSLKHRIVLPLSPVLRFGRFEPFSGHFPSGNDDAGDTLILDDGDYNVDCDENNDVYHQREKKC